MYLNAVSLGRMPLSSAFSLPHIPLPIHGWVPPLLPPTTPPSPPLSRCCPYVLTAHKAKQHMKADCTIAALNQASFASNCFLRRGRNKIRRQKERRGRGWNDATLHSSLLETERSEHRVKREMCNVGSCSYFSGVSVKAAENWGERPQCRSPSKAHREIMSHLSDVIRE